MINKKFYKLVLSIGFILVLILSFKIISYHKNDKAVVIGNNLNVSYIDETFASNQQTIKYLLDILENDSSKIYNNKTIKISSYLKKTKTIIVNIGKNDILSLIDDNLTIDEQIFDRKVEIYSEYIDKIIKLVKKYNTKAIIKLCLIDYPFTKLEEKIIKKINDFNKILKNIVYNNDIEVFTSVSFFILEHKSLYRKENIK